MSATKGKKSKQKKPENEIYPSVQIVTPSLYEIPICALKELACDCPPNQSVQSSIFASAIVVIDLNHNPPMQKQMN